MVCVLSLFILGISKVSAHVSQEFEREELFFAEIPVVLAATREIQLKTAVIAVIKSQDIEPYNTALEGFNKALKEEGTEAKLLNYDMEGNEKRGHKIAKEVISQKPDLVLTLGTRATRIAAQDIKDIPVVFSMVLAPVASGFVKSMKSSGSNLTGASMDIPIKTQFEWLKKVVPSVKKIGVLYNPDENKVVIDRASKTAENMKLKLIAMPVYSEKDLPKATQDLTKEIDALWAVADSTVFNSSQSIKFILLHTLRTKMPFMGLSNAFVKAGALLALSCNYKDIGRQSGESAIRILAGETPGKIPITVPRRIHLSLNHRVAEQIGIEFSDEILQKARRVYK